MYPALFNSSFSQVLLLHLYFIDEEWETQEGCTTTQSYAASRWLSWDALGFGSLASDPVLAAAQEGDMTEAIRWSWCHPLSAHRVKKLKETLVAVQQLDKNMSSLRTWLALIESELAKPIVYDSCDSEEIQRKLNEQQVKLKTIEESK